MPLQVKSYIEGGIILHLIIGGIMISYQKIF